MLDDLYQDRTDKLLDDRASRNLPPQVEKPGFWQGVLTAAPRGFAIAVNETARVAYRAGIAVEDARLDRQLAEADDFTRDALLKQYGERAVEREQMDAQLKSGIQFWRADPTTQGTAAQVVQGAAGFVTKVGLYTAATRNPYAGAVAAGADIGGTEYLELRDQGVDQQTAARVGAVRGTSAAVAALLPAAGSTLAKTVGLAAFGGPVTYVAENAAAKAILESADYSKLANQIDPFDPVGLSAATVGATLFGLGGYALRRGRVEDGRAPTPEEVDAAVVIAGREVTDAGRLVDPSNLRAAAADDMASQRAELQLARGDRVDVTDATPFRDGGDVPAKLIEFESKVRDEVQSKPRDTGESAVQDTADIAPARQVEGQQDVPPSAVPDVEWMRDDGTKIKASDYLREVEEQARIETQDASLIQVAASCLLETM